MLSTTYDHPQGNIDVGDSPIMNEDQQELFFNITRTRSDESILGKLFPIDDRPLIMTIPTHVSCIETGTQGINTNLFKKIEKKKNQSDYNKNICGYITKKIIRQCCSSNYTAYVKSLCKKHKIDYQSLKNFYLPKIQQVTGPSHIPGLLTPSTKNEIGLKKTFRQFFEWFIKNRYLRYLLIQGKMSNKKAYIKYKNYLLLSIIRQTKDMDSIQDDSSEQIKKTKPKASKKHKIIKKK